MIPVKLVDVVVREREIELTEEQKQRLGESMPDVELSERYTRKHYQLVLMEETGHRALVVWIGEYEGLAIAAKLNGRETARPLTQVFMHRLIEASGATLERVEISALKDEVFYATAYLRVNDEMKSVDARPSDAIALALYTDTPLFVSDDVMSNAGIAIPDNFAPTGKGLAEIQARLESMKAAEAQLAAPYVKKADVEPWHDSEREAQIVISKAFAAPES